MGSLSIGFHLFEVIFFLWSFWALYVFTMGIYRAYLSNRLSGINLWLSLPIVFIAVLVDIIINFSIAIIIFCDLPFELLVTQRLLRYKCDDYPTGFRKSLATFICDNMLDVFDPRGEHC